MKCLLVRGDSTREEKHAESLQWVAEEDNPQWATGTGSICVDVPLISSLGRGCYECPVMRGLPAERHAVRGTRSVVG